MKGIDTNVLVRYLVQDDKKQSELANRFIEKKCTADSPGFVNHIVLCELCWVLSGNYKVTRGKIAEVIDKLLSVAQLQILQPELVWKANQDYRDSSADFADLLIARINEQETCDFTVTFDLAAAKHSLFRGLK